MCELMGYHFAQPLVADFSIREFGQRGLENADGWGLAWYPDESLALVKEPLGWQASKHTDFLETYPEIRAAICIAHVRHRTRGRLTHADTHPFARELNGTEFCFAHNGTVPQAFDLPMGRFHPVGQTDSEYVFCHLLGQIADWPELLGTEAAWPRLLGMAAGLNKDSRLNFLLSDGRRLFAYHDQGGW
jgi:predicted glutamine amidotransferase